MKVHEYREMMRYLTRRPAPSNPLLEASDEGQEFAEGGRIGFKVGGGKKILDLITELNKKLKDKKNTSVVKTADEVDRPELAKEREMFDDFNKRNRKIDKSKQLPKKGEFMEDGETPDYEYYAELLNDSEDSRNFNVQGDETIEVLEDRLKQLKDEEAYMYAQYKMGKFDPEPGEINRSRLYFLRQRAEDAEMTRDFRLFGEDEFEELSSLEKRFEYLDLEDKAQNISRKMTDKETQRLKEINDSGYVDFQIEIDKINRNKKAEGGRIGFKDGGVEKFYTEQYLNPDSAYNKFKPKNPASQTGINRGKNISYENLNPQQRYFMKKAYERSLSRKKIFDLVESNEYITLDDLGERAGKKGEAKYYSNTGKDRVLGSLKSQILEGLKREPSAERRNLKTGDFAKKFLKKELNLKQVDAGQGKLTWIMKNPNEEQLKKIKDYYLRKGAKYGITSETVDLIYKLWRDPVTGYYLKKGEIVPEKIMNKRLPNLGLKPTAFYTAAHGQYRLAQILNGTEFINVDKLKIPTNKKLATNLFKAFDKFPWGTPMAIIPYEVALETITNNVGKTYFDTRNFSSMKREARRILNEAKIPVYDPRKKNSYGVNLNEIAGVKATARTGMAPYGTFVNLLEGKLNTSNYARFLQDFEEKIFELKKAVKSKKGNPNQVIEDYNTIRSTLIKNTKGLNDSNVPKLSIKSPTKIYGLERISELNKLGLNLENNFIKTGVTIDMGNARTIKEFLSNPNAKGIYQKLSGKSPNIPFVGKVFAASMLPAIIGSQYLPEALRDLGLIDRTYEQTAGIGDMPIKEISPSFAEQATTGAATAGTALGASKGLFGKFAGQIAKGAGKILGATFSLPTRLTGLDRMVMRKIGMLPEDQTIAETYDPTTTEGRIGLELEATALGAYKPIAESLSSGIKNKTAQTVARNILSLGPTAKILARAARITTPLGLASLAGEGVFYLGKKYLEEKKRRDALTPSQREQEDRETYTQTSQLAETGQFATEEDDDLDIPLLPKSNSTTKEGILNLRSDEEDD
jgi:hypothetical protein